jgi:hypothetical protein
MEWLELLFKSNWFIKAIISIVGSVFLVFILTWWVNAFNKDK